MDKKLYQKKNEKIVLYLLCIEIIVILCAHLFNVDSMYGFFLSGDEVGYWGNTAFLLGKDWGNVVKFIGYYSYGYSIFLMLIMSLPVSATIMYRIALVANALFMVASFLISYNLFIRLFPNKNRIYISVSCTAMTLYSSYISQSSIAWSECFLVLFVWLILLQGYLISQKATSIRIFIFAVEIAYIYMIHQRTIPFLIAGVIYITVLCLQKCAKIKHLFILILTDAGMLALASVLKNLIKSSIYRAGAWNDYTSVLGEINKSNLVIPAMRELAGQFFYLWTASFGLIPLGIGLAAVFLIKKWKEKDSNGYFYGFVLLSFLGVLGVSSIASRLGTRVDHLIYGRYIEIAIGFFLCLGFLSLLDFIQEKKSWIILCFALLCYSNLALLLDNKIHEWNIPLDSYYQGICAVGTFWLYLFRGFRVLDFCAILLVIQIILFVLLKIFSKKKWIVLVITICIAIFWFYSGEIVVEKQIIPYQSANNQVLSTNSSLWQYIRQNDLSVAFLSSNLFNTTQGDLQFYIQDQPLNCISDINDVENLPEILIVDTADSIISNDLDDYIFIGYVGKRSIFSLNDIDANVLQRELDTNMFYHKTILINEKGWVMYGPYITLPPGDYEVTFIMDKKNAEEGILGELEVSIKGDPLVSKLWDGTSASITLSFQLEDLTENVEFRYFKYEGNDSEPIAVMLEPLN